MICIKSGGGGLVFFVRRPFELLFSLKYLWIYFDIIANVCRTWSQGWRQKSSDRGAGASDKVAEMAENAVCVRHFAKFSRTETQNFLWKGG